MLNNREKYLEALKSELENNIYYHSLALEACMGKIYDYLQSQGQIGSDEPERDDWVLAGLIHDIDYSKDYKDQHPNKTKEALVKYNLEISDGVLQIVRTHSPEHTGVQPKTKAEWAIFCADSLTGFITAVALIYPSKKLADVKLSSILKRFIKEPKFASGTRREEVAKCANPDGLNIHLEKFAEICLEAMKNISSEIGL